YAPQCVRQCVHLAHAVRSAQCRTQLANIAGHLRVSDSQFGKLPAQLYRPASLRKTGVDDTSEFDDVLLQASVKPARQVQAVLVNTTRDRLLHTFRYATVLQGKDRKSTRLNSSHVKI